MPLQTIEPTTKLVVQFINELKTGRYLLPAFQRNYVWDPEDVKELLKSMMDRIPIGVIVLWKASESFTKQLPFARPLVDIPGAAPDMFVIDGQQRLTSLLLLFSDWDIKRAGEPISIPPIFYYPQARQLSMRRGGVDLARLAKAIENPLGPEAQELRQTFPEEQRAAATKVLQSIRDYRVPTYVVETNQEDDQTVSAMARAFIQLNKQGVRISNIELLLSLLAGTWRPEIREEIDTAYTGLDRYGLDLQPFLRLTMRGLGLSQTVVSKPEQFEHAVKGLAQGPLGDSVRRAAQAMDCTFALLREELGISDLSLVPSQVALVPPAFFLQSRGVTTPSELSGVQQRKIAAWFLLANFKGRYSGSVDTKLEHDLRVVEDSQGDFPFDSLVQNMKPHDQRISWADFERARRIDAMRTGGRHFLFLLFTLLVKNNATDWTEWLLRARPSSELAKHHIFPVEWLTEHLYPEDGADGEDTLINHFANLTWVYQVKNAEISDRSPEDYIRQTPDEEWQVSSNDADRHFVPVDRALLDVQRYEEFLEERMRKIFQFVIQTFPEISEAERPERGAEPKSAVLAQDTDLRALFESLRARLEQDGVVRHPTKHGFRFKKERVFANVHFRKKYLLLELRVGRGRVSDPDFKYWRHGESSWGYTHVHPLAGIREKVVDWISLARDYVKSKAEPEEDEEIEPKTPPA